MQSPVKNNKKKKSIKKKKSSIIAENVKTKIAHLNKTLDQLEETTDDESFISNFENSDIESQSVSSKQNTSLKMLF